MQNSHSPQAYEEKVSKLSTPSFSILETAAIPKAPKYLNISPPLFELYSRGLGRYHDMSIEFNNTLQLEVVYHEKSLKDYRKLSYLNQSSGKGCRILSGQELGLVFQWNKIMKLNAIFLNLGCCTPEDSIHTSLSQ